MVVKPHFMDIDWKLHKRIINFKKITSHKVIDIGKTLCACLNAWGIVKVLSITVDNASANDGAVVYVGNKLNKDFNDLLLDGKYLHLRNHAVEVRIDGMENVPTNVVIRWNSTFKKLDCAFKYKIVFNRMVTIKLFKLTLRR
ncbi:hypothetical protein L3X38_036900 [Prunus dulcis]|uniref:Uncharacterized protein n=1 Tax=Prunus dulcis TaxID=3755 RepID=A0AAD4V2N3_PRUDU|nr:hypothetical protein L3X38_036900 [Prunus dulcis]